MSEQASTQFQIQGMDCANCARSIEEGVGKLKGVQECQVDFTTQRMRVSGSVKPRAVMKRVRQLGFEAQAANLKNPSEPSGALQDEPSNFFGHLMRRKESRWATLGALLILPGLVWTEILAREFWLVDVLSVLAMAAAGWPVGRSAYRALSINREININVLMSLAAVGAVIIGAYTEAGMVMVLFALGESLEGYTASRARRSIRSLMQVAPDKARRIRSGEGTEEVEVSQLQVGDRILVKPGERIPMDGQVESGYSSVNQAPITGESQFVDKEPGEEVYAGTINGQGTLEVLVNRPASDSTINRMIQLVEEAKCRQAPAQRFVNRFARIYTPVVVALAALTAALPPLIWGLPFWNPAGDETGWLYRGLALLVVACPCALVISTPVSIISAISQGARYGILFKGGASLEALSRVRAVAFDKTGTLTEGSPVVVQVRSEHCGEPDSEDCEDCNDLVALVSAVERRSEHPLARAVVSESIARGVAGKYPDAVNVTALKGQGVSGQVNGRSIQIGSHRLFDSLIPHREDHCSEAGQAAELGYTPVMVSAEGQYLGFLSLADTVRQTSREALQGLRRMGLQALVMLTGDSAGTAHRVADEVGVTDVRADLMPENKVVAVEDLMRMHGAVAMVGDGINDTPALSSATVGIALGGSAGGTDQALEASDITLLGGDLRRLPFALRLSRSAMRTIQANVALSLLLKLAFLILVIVGLGTMWMAVLADVGTSLLVTLNGMHLLRWPRPEWDMEPV